MEERLIVWPAMAAVAYGVLFLLANRSVYHPFKYPAGYWDGQRELGAEDVWIRTRDDVRIHGWLVRRQDSPWMTLHVHGNGGNITHRVAQAHLIHSAGSSVLLLDYRGYGRSAGSPTERGLYSDAEAAYEHLVTAGYAPERIILHGESLGTAVAAHLAARKPCAGVVLEAPFTSARAVANRVLPLLGPLLFWGFDTKARMEEVRRPVLVIHGDRDEVIPFEMGRAVFAAANEPKSFWAVHGAGHNDISDVARAEYPTRLSAFYRQLSPR